jgi:hypothetical protein
MTREQINDKLDILSHTMAQVVLRTDNYDLRYFAAEYAHLRDSLPTLAEMRACSRNY